MERLVGYYEEGLRKIPITKWILNRDSAMKEILEIRINYEYANLLFKSDESKDVGTSVKVVEITKDDPRYNQIPVIAKQIKEKYGKGFYFGWQIKRRYNIQELDASPLFHIKIKTEFEPAGEECGTSYDESVGCVICGANRKQRGPLRLKYGSIPKKDIAKTIAGEIIVSEKFAAAFNQMNLNGALLEPVFFEKGISNYYQLVASSPELQLTKNTITGVNPFEYSEGNSGGVYNISGYNVVIEREIYKCPQGHTIGLNLLSEPYILNTPSIDLYDFFASKQKIGVKRGLLRPEPLYLCSPAFRKMVEEEKLSGFDFEIAHIE